MFLLVIVSVVSALIISALFTWIEIPVLRKKQMGQNIREEGPKSHMAKAGTPTMGGIALIGGAVISCIAVSLIYSCFDITTAIMIIVTVLFGIIGFLDDFLKKFRKQNEGLNPKQKMIFLLAVSLGVSIWAYFENDASVYIPFYNDYICFGWAYIPFIIFAVVAMTNAVNLTDGLDGLASGCTAFSALFFALAANMVGADNTAVFAASIAGGCLGFLIFNKNPAKIFMGDTGSLALGGAVVIAAISLRLELFLILAGLVYVLEALSVVIQVAHFKRTGNRVFRMAPIHHHFELGGMSEKKVVLMFWSFTFLCCIAGLLILGI